MRILIDGDGCPVIDIVENIARQKKIKLIIFTDTAHQIKTDYGEVFLLDTGFQSVDMAINEKCRKNDIVVTQDYGLAALVLSKGARAISQDSLVFTDDNIDHLLMTRHLHAKKRRAGKKHPNQSKRREEDDLKFRKTFLQLIDKI